MMDVRTPAIVGHLEALGFTFRSVTECPWLRTVENSFGERLPEPYRSFIQFYRFEEFDVPRFESFSNLGEGAGYDITDGPFKDPALCEWLIPRRYLQIGRPQFANYDPVCFDMRSGADSPRIVRFDHEDILLLRKKVEPVIVAKSFMELVGAGEP